MVGAQEEAIRAAHQLPQMPSDEAAQRALAELAQAQETLKTGAEYLSKGLPESEALESTRKQLEKAATALQKSADQIRAEDTKEARKNVRDALGQLAAVRKEVHHAVKRDPAALPSPLNSTDPMADLLKQLQQFNESQKQLRTAADEAAKMAKEQRELAERTKLPNNVDHKPTAEQQKKLRDKFEQFRKEQSQACKLASGQCNRAGSAMSKATSAMQSLASQNTTATQQSANQAAGQSAEALRNLAESLGRQAGNQENILARQLQRALDRQIQYLEQVEQNPGNATEQELAQASENMKSTTSELQKMANDSKTRKQFSDKLREELNPENKKKLDGQCQGVCNNPGGGAGRKQAAGAAKAGLQRVAQAMQPGERPGGAPRPGGSDPLRTDSSQALARARQQLESLMRSAQLGRRPSPSEQRQLLRDALRNMQIGKAPAGRGSAPNDPTSALEDLPKEEDLQIDMELLRRLLAQLEQVQVEQSPAREANEKPNVTNLDPQNYPPGYRDWIQRYYRHLAEQP
jgi:hypothetical protein